MRRVGVQGKGVDGCGFEMAFTSSLRKSCHFVGRASTFMHRKKD